MDVDPYRTCIVRLCTKWIMDIQWKLDSNFCFPKNNSNFHCKSSLHTKQGNAAMNKTIVYMRESKFNAVCTAII